MIDPDGGILIRSPHNEMGQGAITALPMIVAEELECDWSKVRVEYASASRNLREHGVYGDMVTAGSRGVRTSWQMLQQAGASARERLIAAAARRWNVPAHECEAANSKVVHKPSGRTLDYGALAADAAKITLDKEPAIRTPDKFKLIGKPMPRLDTPLKIDGSAKFGIDTQIPGMVYAAIAACPVAGGKLKSVDEAPAMGRRGITTWSSSTTRSRSSPTASGAPRRRWRCSSPNGTPAKPARPTARNSPSSIATRSTARW